jgi:multisubunit Na+/H+ antiporter MnhG subunit
MRSRAHLAWLGILLVLMQLLAPTISHAIVRASSTGTATIGWAAPAPRNA